MLEVEKYLPEKYKWNPQKGGLIREYREKEVWLCDCIPIQIKKQNIINLKMGKEEEVISFFLIDTEGRTLGSTEGPYKCRKSELNPSKLAKLIAGDVIFAPGASRERSVYNLFICIIKSVYKNQEKPEVVLQREFGWNDTTFYWGGDLSLNKGSEYTNMLKICNLLTRHIEIPALLLAACHGIVRKILFDAHITHNFTTFIVGV